MFKTHNKLKTGGQILLIPQELITPNPYQPRKEYDYDELEGLSESIRQNGILQPVNVRPMENTYQLISGERRLRAARMAGLTRIPCIIMDINDENCSIFSIIENIQRQDLNFFDEATAINTLIYKFNLTQEDISRKLGKSQSAISNKLRLLKIPEDMREIICRGNLTERHARALLQLESNEQREKALNDIIKRKLSVAQSEELIKNMLQEKELKRERPGKKLFKDVRIFINTIDHAVETMKKAGINAESEKNETNDFVEYIVRIPKIKQKRITQKKNEITLVK